MGPLDSTHQSSCQGQDDRGGDSDAVTQAAAVLRRGGLVAIPTETVYGLGADARNELAVRRIFGVKGRPSTHPLIVHVADASALDAWAIEIPDVARALAQRFWPGPLTLVLRRSALASDAVTGGQETIALRVPNHPLTLALLRALDGGIAAPSANRFGGVSPTTADHVRSDLGSDVDFILDGGPCTVGLESTILDVSALRGSSQEAPTLLRPGGLAREEVERFLGQPLADKPQTDVRAPGMLASHYAPRAGLRLTSPEALERETAAAVQTGRRVAVMAPADFSAPSGSTLFPIPAEAEGVARVLYATLRDIDAQGYELIVTALPASSGLGLAVQDRLSRAAAPRPRDGGT